MLSANFIITLNYILWVYFTLITVNWLQGVPRVLKQRLRDSFENLRYKLPEKKSAPTCLNNFLYSRHPVSTVNFVLNMLHSLTP